MKINIVDKKIIIQEFREMCLRRQTNSHSCVSFDWIKMKFDYFGRFLCQYRSKV